MAMPAGIKNRKVLKGRVPEAIRVDTVYSNAPVTMPAIVCGRVPASRIIQ